MGIDGSISYVLYFTLPLGATATIFYVGIKTILVVTLTKIVSFLKKIYKNAKKTMTAIKCLQTNIYYKAEDSFSFQQFKNEGCIFRFRTRKIVQIPLKRY